MEREISELRKEFASLRDRLLVLEDMLLERSPDKKPVLDGDVKWADDERDVCFGCGETVDTGSKHVCWNN